MVDIATEVVKPAGETMLISVKEAKVMLKITDNVSDDLIESVIREASGEISAICNNRVFAKETVIETFRDLEEAGKRIWLTHYPVREIISVTPVVAYECNTKWGRLRNLDGDWAASEPVVIQYIGGYELPFESPMALRRACMILTREGYYASIRGDASVRMIAHKESRVIYFDPSAQARAAAGGGGGAGGTAGQRAAKDLLTHFTRYEV